MFTSRQLLMSVIWLRILGVVAASLPCDVGSTCAEKASEEEATAARLSLLQGPKHRKKPLVDAETEAASLREEAERLELLSASTLLSILQEDASRQLPSSIKDIMKQIPSGTIPNEGNIRDIISKNMPTKLPPGMIPKDQIHGVISETKKRLAEAEELFENFTWSKLLNATDPKSQEAIRQLGLHEAINSRPLHDMEVALNSPALKGALKDFSSAFNNNADMFEGALKQFEGSSLVEAETFEETLEETQMNTNYRDCYMNGGNPCSIEDMSHNSFTRVFPGGETRCIVPKYVKNGADYHFFVMKGDPMKVLMFFGNAGGCFDRFTFATHTCDWHPRDPGNQGIFDRWNPDNPYRDYTLVVMMGCDGSAYTGMTERDWSFSFLRGATVSQQGWRNSEATMNWAYQNVAKGIKLENLIVAGSGSGGPAANAYGSKLLKNWQYENAAILADSDNVALPFGADGRMAIDYGVCDSGAIPGNITLLNEALGKSHWLSALIMVPDVLAGIAARWACRKGLLQGWLNIMGNTLQFQESVNVQITSKTDMSGQSAYSIMEYALFNRRQLVNACDYYAKVRKVYDRFAKGELLDKMTSYKPTPWFAPSPLGVNNFITFTVSDQVTGYLDKKRLYETSVDGTRLSDWLRGIPVRRGRSLKGVCSFYGNRRLLGYEECWDKCPTSTYNEFHRPESPAPTMQPTPEPTPDTPRPTPRPTAAPTASPTLKPTNKGETYAPTYEPGGCSGDDFAKMSKAGPGNAEGSFPRTLSSCGLKAFSLWSGFLKKKMKSCIVDNLELSSSCADCYVAAGEYGVEKCKIPCISSWCSEACLSCSAEHDKNTTACAGGLAPKAAVCEEG
jgi:hypothetical protein